MNRLLKVQPIYFVNAKRSPGFIVAIEENLKLVNPMMSYIHNIPQLHTIPFEHFEHVRLVRPVCTVKRDAAIPRFSYLIVFISL